MALENKIKPLQDINGYLASAVFDVGGNILVKHNASKYTIELSGENVVRMMNTGARTANGGSLGDFHFMQVNCELGVFCAVWAVENQSIVTVLLEPKGNAGLAKVELTKLAGELLV